MRYFVQCKALYFKSYQFENKNKNKSLVIPSFNMLLYTQSLRFKKENLSRLETNQKAQFAGQAAGQWLNLRLQLLGVACVTGVGLISVVQHHFQDVNPGQYQNCYNY